MNKTVNPNLKILRATDEPTNLTFPEERLWAVRQWFLTVTLIAGSLLTTAMVSKAFFGSLLWSPIWIAWVLGVCTNMLVSMERDVRKRRR